jgi:conjugative transfer signal peptidase TraF
MVRFWPERFLSQDKAESEPPLKWRQDQANRSGTRVGRCQKISIRCWPLVVALAVAAGASAAARLGFGVNVSASAPFGVYRTMAGTPTRGSLVVVCLPADVATFGRARGYLSAGNCPAAAQSVLKRVVAVTGDTVTLDSTGVSVNGEPLSAHSIHERDQAGRPLPHLPFGDHRVASGHVWMLGLSHTSSWDSRYFGPVPVSGLRGIARPVLTLGEARL